MAPDNASLVITASVGGPSLSPEERSFFCQESVSGVTLFKRNFTENYHSEAKSMINELHSLSSKDHGAFLVAIDQEGGRVSRIGGNFPNQGPALHLEKGASDAQALAKIENYAFQVGTALWDLGININFAPVADILTRDSNTAIGDRAFGRDLATVSSRARSFLTGLQKSGVKGCLKHFPGQGDAPYDTHKSSATIDADKATLWQREIKAFEELLPHVSMIMVSHCIYPALDAKPATLSKVIMQTVLRQKLKFAGVIVSDDMLMQAIPQDRESWQASIVESVACGTDLVLVCKELERARYALEALRKEEKKSAAFATRLADAAKRVVNLRKSISDRSTQRNKALT